MRTRCDNFWDHLILLNIRNSRIQLQISTLGTITGPKKPSFSSTVSSGDLFISSFDISQSYLVKYKMFKKQMKQKYRNSPTSPSVVPVRLENQSSNQSNLPRIHPNQTSSLQTTIFAVFQRSSLQLSYDFLCIYSGNDCGVGLERVNVEKTARTEFVD